MVVLLQPLPSLALVLCGREITWVLSETERGPRVTIGDSNRTFQDKVNKPKGFVELPLWKKLQIKTLVEKSLKIHMFLDVLLHFLTPFETSKKIHCYFCLPRQV